MADRSKFGMNLSKEPQILKFNSGTIGVRRTSKNLMMVEAMPMLAR